MPLIRNFFPAVDAWSKVNVIIVAVTKQRCIVEQHDYLVAGHLSSFVSRVKSRQVHESVDVYRC